MRAKTVAFKFVFMRGGKPIVEVRDLFSFSEMIVLYHQEIVGWCTDDSYEFFEELYRWNVFVRGRR